MKAYKKVYPGELEFTRAPSGIKVEYPDTIIKKRNPDIWALKYLLDKGLYDFKGKNSITLRNTDPTMALRLYFLPKIFSGAAFITKDDFKSQAKEIIEANLIQTKTQEIAQDTLQNVTGVTQNDINTIATAQSAEIINIGQGIISYDSTK